MKKESFFDLGLLFEMELDQLEEQLLALKISSAVKSTSSKKAVPGKLSHLGQDCREQIRAYLSGDLKNFRLPCAPRGTAFQQKVWQELAQIPYGKVISYKQLAERVESPRGYRAVGSANGANPIPLILPCHRVVTHKKSLGGYSLGLELKKRFLSLEGLEF